MDATTIDPLSGTLTLAYASNENGAAELTVRATDPLGLSVETRFSVTVTALNDAPVNTVPGTQRINQNDSLVFSSATGNAVSVSDLDALASEVQVDLSVPRGSLSLATTEGLSFMQGDGQQNTQMSFRGTVAAINAALDGLVFEPQAGWAGSTSLQMRVDDLGNTGSGGALADIRHVAISVLETSSGTTTPSSAPQNPNASTPPPVDSFILDLVSDEDTAADTPIEVRENAEAAAEADPDTNTSVQSEELRLFGESASAFASVDLDDDNTRRTLGKFVKVKQLAFEQQHAGILETLQFLGANGQKLVDHVIWGQLDALSDQMTEADKEGLFSGDSIAFKTAAGISFTLSAGYVTWLLNSGSLAASMLSLTPLWTHFDPIPIVSAGSTQNKANIKKDKSEIDSRTRSAEEKVNQLFGSD